MSKLIYAASLEGFKRAFSDWENTTSSVYKSIAFTNDGYLYTHGKIFQMSPTGSENPFGLSLGISGQKLSVTLSGYTDHVDLPIIDINTPTDRDLTITKSNGIYSIDHKNRLDENTTFGSTVTSEESIFIPSLSFNNTGHLLSGNNTPITLNKVKIEEDSELSKVFITTANKSGNTTLLINSSLYANLTSGSLYASKFFQNGESLENLYSIKNHASSENSYGIGSNILYGHLKLSDSISSNLGINDGVASTPKAVLDAINTVKEYSKTLLGTTDAMVFVGTISGNGTIISYNSVVVTQDIIPNETTISQLINYSAGWTFKIISNGSISGIGRLETGDMLICTSDYTSSYNAKDWTAIQTNIDGAVSISSNLLENSLIIGSSSTTVTSLANGEQGQYLIIGSSGIPEWTSIGVSMRAIKYNGIEFISSNNNTALDIQEGEGISITGTSSTGKLTISSSGVRDTYPLIFNNDSIKVFEYQPKSKSSTINITGGLKLELIEDIPTLSHSNTYTSKQEGLYKITVDKYGHVSAGDLVESLPNKYALNIQSSSGTKIDSYNGSVEKTIKLVNGTDISLTPSTSNNIITITPSITHRYRPISIQNNEDPIKDILSNSNSGKLVLKSGENVTINNDSNTIIISAMNDNTWRDVKANIPGKSFSPISIGVSDLIFGEDFIWEDSGKLLLGWTEISETGEITYVV